MLHFIGALHIVTHHINNGYQKQFVAFLFGVILPRLCYLFEVAHAIDFNKDTLLRTEEVEAATAIFEILHKFHA